MAKSIKISKGLDIKLKGVAEKLVQECGFDGLYALKPTDFHGLTIKLNVKEGDIVKAGSPLFVNKYIPEMQFTSPVSGEVVEIKRGEQRKVLEVKIRTNKLLEYQYFDKIDIETASKEDIINLLLKSGLWPCIIQRPYSIIAKPTDIPKSIHISCFDTAPLAVDYEFTLKDDIKFFQTGVNVLKKLCFGKVHLNLNAKISRSIFTDVKNAEINYFEGPHPAGNVGIQIHHLEPINKGEIIWVVNPQHVVYIGKLFELGIYDVSKNISVAGSEVKSPKYYKLISGTSIKNIIESNTNSSNVRIISGNVLTGTKISEENYLGFYHNMLTIIPEGNFYELFGWLLPGFGKFSFSRTFFSWLFPKKEFALHTNLNGGERALVVTGQYEKVLPMDILPMQLIKAILAEDVDLMENLGIYEIAEEDMALCEFICTSKTEIQEIIRKGLDLVAKEMN